MTKIKLRSRIRFVFYVFMLAFFILIINLFRIQVLQHKFWSDVAYRQYHKSSDIIGKRGRIILNTGEEIAYDLDSYELVLDPTKIPDDKIAKISKIFADKISLDYKEVYNKISEKKIKKNRYLKLAKGIYGTTKDEIKKELRLNKLNRVPVYFLSNSMRIYPKQDQFKHIVGFINSKKNGIYGIEKSFDKYLQPKNGFISGGWSTPIPDSETGSVDFPISKVEYIEPKNGKNIVLTIDYVIQHILSEELEKQFKETNSNWGAGIIVEVDTGRILAMSSLPLIEKNKNLRNNLIYNQYEPGSVIKPIIMAAALDSKLLDPNEIFTCKGWVKVYNAIIKDHDNSTVGDLTVSKIIEKSSNVGMVKVSERFTNEQFYKYLLSFGFDGKTHIDLSGERKIYLTAPEKWDGVKKATMSFGQGIATTPIQMAMAFTAVINGGDLYKPQIIDRIEDDDGTIVYKYKPEIREKIISDDVSKQIRNMLKLVVEQGTGVNAKIKGYEIGGKTGTSQKSGGKSGYSKGKYIASFAGFFPVEKPKYMCLMLLDEPKGKKIYGGQIIAPVFKNIMKRIIRYKNIPPEDLDGSILELPEDIDVIENEYIVEEKLTNMPELIGLSLRDALKKLSSFDGDIVFKGKGKIKDQFPKSGISLEGLKKIKLVLEDK